MIMIRHPTRQTVEASQKGAEAHHGVVTKPNARAIAVNCDVYDQDIGHKVCLCRIELRRQLHGKAIKTEQDVVCNDTIGSLYDQSTAAPIANCVPHKCNVAAAECWRGYYSSKRNQCRLSGQASNSHCIHAYAHIALLHIAPPICSRLIKLFRNTWIHTCQPPERVST